MVNLNCSNGISSKHMKCVCINSPPLCVEGIARRDGIWGGCSIFLRWKDQDIERLKRGGCDEREK